MHFDAHPEKQGLYDPALEKDACGVGFIADMTGKPSHDTVKDAAIILTRLNHRGACGCEEETGDGAGMLIAIPDKLYRKVSPGPRCVPKSSIAKGESQPLVFVFPSLITHF